ncbi:hypothetical protein RHGRI_011168 [Rhododendron griersonianum]|uniref:Uncharacterized protein n=1 Tax=Rhododendron griersonianum TaxID=479676 RepID=A0AAV6KM13_9ERIC|nr:hypothetical protein RHGRI_036595 [Rhododendron griersonianum]KAG5544232.1 hypothetical protein RHGRI_016851 [Rhododendron griersonianum]KAG5553212.1 hypothetical protein RHGRI_011168 [Rhododendron griersonianum]
MLTCKLGCSSKKPTTARKTAKHHTVATLSSRFKSQQIDIRLVLGVFEDQICGCACGRSRARLCFFWTAKGFVSQIQLFLLCRRRHIFPQNVEKQSRRLAIIS